MSKTESINGTYEVGYGRPPKAHQFAKGCSGNPNGRPKGTRNLKSDLAEELGEHVTLSEGGKPITLSKQRALLKSLVARAIKGDGRAVNALLNLMVRVLDPSDGEEADEPLTSDEEAILVNFEQRILASANVRGKSTGARKRAGSQSKRPSRTRKGNGGEK